MRLIRTGCACCRGIRRRPYPQSHSRVITVLFPAHQNGAGRSRDHLNNRAGDSMPRDGEPLFELAAWTPALEKYGAVVALSVELYDSASCLVCGPVFPTPLFELVASNGSPSEFAECASRCLAQTG